MLEKIKKGVNKIKEDLRSKRLYKSDDQILGGVCGGIAEYFDIDPTIVRLSCVILFLIGAPIPLLYILGWVIMPDKPTPRSTKGINKE